MVVLHLRDHLVITLDDSESSFDVPIHVFFFITVGSGSCTLCPQEAFVCPWWHDSGCTLVLGWSTLYTPATSRCCHSEIYRTAFEINVGDTQYGCLEFEKIVFRLGVGVSYCTTLVDRRFFFSFAIGRPQKGSNPGLVTPRAVRHTLVHL